MARKGENIYHRDDGRWEGRYPKGRKPDGEIHYGYVYAKKYGDVKELLLPLKCEYADRKKTNVCFSGTVQDWARYWLEEVAKPRVKESTLAFYASTLRNHILPALGERKLNGVTQGDVQALADSLAGKGLGANTIHGVMGVLNRMTQTAIERNMLLMDPCKGVTLPKRKPPVVRALSKAEQEKLESAALDDNYGLAVILALNTGMRIGEISALGWKDVDLEKGEIQVRQTAQRIENVSEAGGTRVVFGEPKSAYSKREIPITETLKRLLAEEQTRSRSDYVISCGSGVAEPRVVRYRLARIAHKAGLSGVRFHSLRHTFATRAMESRMNITTLSRIMGHVSVKMTLDVYTDSSWEQKAKAMRRFERMSSGKKKSA